MCLRVRRGGWAFCYLFIFSYCPLPSLSLQVAASAQSRGEPYAGQRISFLRVGGFS